MAAAAIAAAVPEWIDLDWPSIERPFGVRLWPIFDKGFEAVKGYSATDFEYVPNSTIASKFSTCIFLLSLYYFVIFSGREVMRPFPAFRLNTLFKLHNLMLTIISGGLLALFMEQIIPTVAKHGLFYSVCNANGGWTPQLVVLYYLNYLTKYLELLDTVFLFLKKKPLTFLHTYHHGATALLCFTQMLGKTSVSWVVISLNLTVHVVMYWYYFQSARGIRVSWKKYITRMQIIQFVIDLGFVFFAAHNYFASRYRPSLPHYGSCNGEEFAALSGIFILSSYLFLFILFYIATYKKSSPASSTLAVDTKSSGRSTAVAADDQAAQLKKRGPSS